MHITLEADYAIRIVDALAQEGGIVDARTLSERTGVPLRFSMKILRGLMSSGIVKSFKGAKGGYMLVGEPCRVTLRQVIEAIEGPYQFSRCLEEAYPCTMENCNCRFHGVFNDISRMVRNRLDGVTFEPERG